MSSSSLPSVKTVALVVPILAVAFLLALKFVVLPWAGVHNSGGYCDASVRDLYRSKVVKEGELKGKRVLFVVSSWTTMGSRVLDNGTLAPYSNHSHRMASKKTGVHIQEFAHPAYIFTDLGMEVDFATPEGNPGLVDTNPRLVEWMLADWASARFHADDAGIKTKFASPKKIADVDFASYDIVSITGGWGPAFDLPVHKPLGAGLVAAHKSGKTVLGGICHGVLGFRTAVDATGANIARGRKCTGVTDKFSRQMGIWDVPGMYHPEDTLRNEVGCDFTAHTLGRGPEFLAGSDTAKSVTRDDPFVFGQNQNTGCLYAYTLLDSLRAVQA